MSGPPGQSRAALLARLRADPVWDVLVVGGGASGLGCAVDAAARGYQIALVEARDFAQGTSSRSTKLIHGGVRYLAQGRLGLVREALHERARLLENAPHLVRPLRFVVPARRWSELATVGAGLGLYDLLAGRGGIGRSRLLGAAETRAALPGVKADGLCGGVAYWDAQFDDARLALALARTLADLGGVPLNHCALERLLIEDGVIRGAVVRDTERAETFALRARVVINATGVWSDQVRRLANPAAPATLRPSQGVHLVVDRAFLPGRQALLVPRTEDGRVLFMIPWQDRLLLGTTDTARADLPLEPEALPGEVDFILSTAARYLERAPGRADVLSVFAGLRPLLESAAARNSGELSREHLVEVSAQGLVSMLGGKWTTYRSMAADAVDAAIEWAGLPARPCATASLRLHGAAAPRGDRLDAYGSDLSALESLPGAGRVLVEGLDLTEAEVRHAARAEWARGVEDVLARRHRALFLDATLAACAAPAVAQILAAELGRDEGWVGAQTDAFHALASAYGASLSRACAAARSG